MNGSQAAARLSGPKRAALIAMPLVFSAAVWAPILGCYFFGDDLLNLYWIVDKSLLEYLITPYGGHLLLTRNAIFALCFHLFGTHAGWYFVLVLLTHLVNVALLFKIIRALTHSPRLACLGSVLWGVAPLNQGALGWYSVYGQVLVATIFLWLLLRLCAIDAQRMPARSAPWGWALLLLAASTSFGVGIAVTLVFPLVALLLLPPVPARARFVAVLVVVALVVVALYVGVHQLSAYLYPYPGPRRLNMMIGNILNWRMIATLILHLFGFGLHHLLLGPVAGSAPYGGAVSLAVIAAFATVLVLAAARAPAPVRRQMLACLLVCLACYAIIAAGRVGFFRSFKDLITQAPRYHYLAPLPLAIALCLALGQLQRWRPLPSAARDGLLAAWLVATAIAFAAIGPPIDVHLRARQFTENAVVEIQHLIDTAPADGNVYIPNRPFRGVGPFLVNNPRVYPGLAAVFTVFFPDNTVGGRRVYFVVADPALRAATQGKRTASLLVGPEAGGPGS